MGTSAKASAAHSPTKSPQKKKQATAAAKKSNSSYLRDDRLANHARLIPCEPSGERPGKLVPGIKVFDGLEIILEEKQGSVLDFQAARVRVDYRMVFSLPEILLPALCESNALAFSVAINAGVRRNFAASIA